MKLSRIAAVGATAALVAASTLIVAAPAAAETTVGDITFYEASDVGEEVTNGVWPTNDWFFGFISGTEGTADFTDIGLAFNATPGSEGSVQLLNQNFGAQPADVAALVDMVESFDVLADSATWTFQLPVFGEPAAALPADKEFTTLRPVAQGPFNATGWESEPNAWRTTGAIPGFAANATGSFEDLANALFAGDAPELLAYGLFVDPADSPIIRTIEWGGNTSGFGPPPTRTVSPSSLTPEQLATTGVTFAGSGWIPGTFVYLEIEDANGDEVFFDGSAVEVDADGTFSYTLTLPDIAIGSYLVAYFDDDGYFYDQDVQPGDAFTIEVVVAPLPATGMELQALVIGAGILLLGGVALTAIRVRRA